MLKRLFGIGRAKAPDRVKRIQEGLAHLDAGRPAEARASFEQAMTGSDVDADAWLLIGLSHQREHEHEAALAAFQRAIALRPGDQDTLAALAASNRVVGNVEASISAYRALLERDPCAAQAWNDLGLTLLESGAVSMALEPLEKAVANAPDRADFRFNLGNGYRANGLVDRAIEAYRASLAIDPRYAPAWNNLGIAYHHSGRFAPAIQSFSQALALAPDDADVHNNLGSALQGDGRLSEAVAGFQRALQIDPRHSNAASNLAQAFQELGEDSRAREAFAVALSIAPTDALRIRAATVIPVIAMSRADILETRALLAENIETLYREGVRLERPEREVPTVGFHLAFHGLDDRPLQESLASLYLRACPSLAWAKPGPKGRGRGRIRVGFISRFLCAHSIGKTSRGLIAELNRARFEVLAIHAPPSRDDDMARWIRSHADVNVDLPFDLQAAREIIARLDLDILFFQDIGMDAYTYFLAFSRLAPVQCVSFGFPDTTGIPNMDWWVSSEFFEPHDGDTHYSERLWRARDVGTLAYYYRPERLGDRLSREDFGLDSRGALYLCSHSVFRIHPDFDAVISNLLDADPTGNLVILRGTQPHWVSRYLERLGRTLGDRMARVRVVPNQSHDRFLALMRLADAVLDPTHFNGMNNSLDAFSVGTPVVTLPRTFQRGRHTYGMYRCMGLDHCVASSEDDYVRIAARLGRESDFRQAVSRDIVERSTLLFEDARVVREFERFFEESLECAR